MGLTRAILQGFRAEYPLGKPAESWGFRPGAGSLSLAGGYSSSYALIYASQPWVAICVNKLARGVMRQPLKVYELDGLEREQLRDGPAAEVMRHPNPWTSPAEYKMAIVGSLAIYGNAIVVKSGRARPGMPPSELWNSPWPNWEIVRGVDRPIDSYVFHPGDGKPIPFDPEDVIHFRWWGPGAKGDIVGPSPLEPLRQILVAEDASYRMVTAAMQNGLRPGGAFVIPREVKLDMNRESDKLMLQQFRDEVNKTHGSPDNAFKYLVLHGGVDFKQISQTFEQSEVTEIHKLDREVIVATFDIPAAVVGIVDEANFASIDMYHIMFYQDTLGPINELIEQAHNSQWLNEPIFDGQFVEFDQNDVLKGDFATRVQGLKTMTWLTPNEKRRLDNWAPIDDPRADTLWMPLNEKPIDDPGFNAAPPSTGAPVAELPRLSTNGVH